jgi:hypothetical protein
MGIWRRTFQCGIYDIIVVEMRNLLVWIIQSKATFQEGTIPLDVRVQWSSFSFYHVISQRNSDHFFLLATAGWVTGREVIQ